MTTKYYLVIDGIPGDYFDPSKLLTGAFQVNGFDLATANAGSLGQGARPTTFGPLSLSLNSQSVAGLLAAEASGKTINDVSLIGVSTDKGQPIVTYSLNLTDVNISNVSESAGPDISLTLDYSRIGLVTTGLNAVGVPQPSQSFGWDLATDRSVGPGAKLTNAGHASVAPTVPTKYYLLIEGLNGGAADKTHAGWFNLSGFNIDLANTGNPLQPGAGKDVFSALSLTTANQTDLTALLQLEADGKLLSGLRIEGVDATGQAVYDLNLADALITGVTDQNAGGLGLSFDYKEVSLVTKGQDAAGALVQTGSFGWDKATNQAIDPSTMPSLSVGTAHGAVAPTSYYLVINGIAGDYSDKLLTGAFEVSGFDLPALNAGSVETRPAITSFDPLNLTLDSDTVAALLAAEASGKDLKDVSLVGESTVKGAPAITYSLNLGNAIINELSNATQGIDLTLGYSQIGLVTRGVSTGDTLQTSQSFGWNLHTETSTGPGTSLTSAGSSAVAPTAPTAYHLLINGMNGGSTNQGHAGWFSLGSFHLGVTNSTNPLQLGLGGKTSFADLTLSTNSNQTALTALLLQEADGKALTGVRIEGTSATGAVVYDLNLADVRITALTDAFDGNLGINLDYKEISLVTGGVNPASGKLVQTGSFGWDLVTNQAIDPSTMPSLGVGTAHGTVAPTSYYLVINGIAGDSAAATKLLTGAFKVSQFDLPTVNQAGLPSFGALQLALDGQTLAGLLSAEASGKHISDASLVGISSIHGTPTITYSLNLGNLIIGNVAETGGAGGDGVQVSLGYDQIGLVTRGADTAGALQPSQSFGWDLAQNRSSGPGTSLTNAGSSTVAPTAPTGYFLLIDGLNGGVLDKAHAGWFSLNSFNISAENTTNPLQIGLGGKDVFSNLAVNTGNDTGLTALLQDEAESKRLTGVRIEGVDGAGHAVYDLNIADVLVTGVTDQNTPGLDISFDFNKISLVTQGTGPFGNLVETGSFGWDIATNQAIDPATMPNIAPCYCRGTLILTEHGDVPVEELAIGDAVVTMSGAARPIKWIGRRAYSGRFALGHRDILPVYIKAGAIEDNVPRRDLWISPHHAMYLGGLLIEAIDLVNGVTITQATEVESVEYFHIELDTHDILIAEGSLSESFVDDDSRGMFHNAHEFPSLYPAETDSAAARVPRYCAARCDTGYELEAARRHLAQRAGLTAAGGDARIGKLRGFVDVIGDGCITGWAQNVDHPEAPVCLSIYVEGRLVGQTLANRYRSDLDDAGFGSGCHGFEFEPPSSLKLTADAVQVRRSLDGAGLARLHAALDGRVWAIQPPGLVALSGMSRGGEKRLQFR